MKSAELEAPVPDVVMQMGNVEFALKNYPTALMHYRRSAELEPTEPRVFNNIGATLEEMGEYRQAYEAYQHALEVAPSHRTALVNMSVLELRAGLLDRAQEHLDQAQHSVSQGSDLPLKVARALLASARGDSETASRMLDEAASENRTLVERMVADYKSKIQLVD
jgi:Flp pilus assembly protein TadD